MAKFDLYEWFYFSVIMEPGHKFPNAFLQDVRSVINQKNIN